MPGVRIRMGKKYQATIPQQLSAFGDADRTTHLDPELWAPHGERFQDRVKKAPILQDRRYNVAGSNAYLDVQIVKGMAVRVKDHGWGMIVRMYMRIS